MTLSVLGTVYMCHFRIFWFPQKPSGPNFDTYPVELTDEELATVQDDYEKLQETIQRAENLPR